MRVCTPHTHAHTLSLMARQESDVPLSLLFFARGRRRASVRHVGVYDVMDVEKRGAVAGPHLCAAGGRSPAVQHTADPLDRRLHTVQRVTSHGSVPTQHSVTAHHATAACVWLLAQRERWTPGCNADRAAGGAGPDALVGGLNGCGGSSRSTGQALALNHLLHTCRQPIVPGGRWPSLVCCTRGLTIGPRRITLF